MNHHAIISAHHLNKRVLSGETPLQLLADINLEIPKGSTAAIVGSSGSGKSTLLGLLAGLDQATSGSVTLLGKDLGELDEDERAQLRAGRVGFVFQSFQLLPGLTARENVSLPLELGKGGEDSHHLAEAMLAEVGLAHRLDHFPSQLSGGEQQRVALARAFVTQPEVLFADEPTGNLDSRTGEQVIELMLSLHAQGETTLVLVTHDAQLAARCEHYFRLDSGRLVQS
ncbi:MAG: ABC transporter ATP-binding protein [Thiotrichales bacterium]